MGKSARDPADYDSWRAWQDAREQDGKMPVIAKPVPYAIAAALLLLVVTWRIVDYVGGTLGDEVTRSGTAVISGDCRQPVGGRYQCPAQLSWGGSARVWSTERLSGSVEVEERTSFQPDSVRRRSATNQPQIWATEHTPEARPWLFPVAYGTAGILGIALAGIGIVYGSRWATRRSQQTWSDARRAAGRNT
ncbi:hypothetical protein [Demetria terragena]|uniref:hypothetical protein n=1 Tax=Demetria terragena TaxID=63959 RepID=UPI0003998146|nr:hypothetical protein [Demetria terragena]